MKDGMLIADLCPVDPIWVFSFEMNELFMFLFMSPTGFGEDPSDSGRKVFTYVPTCNQLGLLVVDVPGGGLALGWRRTKEFFTLISEKQVVEALFRRWYEVRASGAVRVLIRVEGGEILIDGRKQRKGGKIVGMAATTLNLEVPFYNEGGDRSVKTLFKFLQALPEEADEEVFKFIEDRNYRELSIGGFELKKKLWKIAINGSDGDEQLCEARVTPGELFKIIPEFRDEMETKPEQIGIIRDNRGLIVVTDQTAEELLFGK